jgi:signal transduction histidine kinase/ligand-binding sensor domain-containing protein
MRLVSAGAIFTKLSSRAFGRVRAAASRYPCEPRPHCRLRFCRTGCHWLLLLVLSVPAFCIDRDLRLDQLHHTAWTAKDGAPGAVRALAQTTDGYLWLGTEGGLFRFDGVRFEPYKTVSGVALPSTNIRALYAVPDRGLWIGSNSGDVSFLQDGKLTNYFVTDGLSRHYISSFRKDSRGRTWLAEFGVGLFLFEGKQWKKVGADWNFFGNPHTIFEDDRGTLWVGSTDRVEYMPAGENRFQLAGDGMQNIYDFAQSRDGTMWMAELGRSVRPVPIPHIQPKQLGPEIHVGSGRILFDDQGSFWITTAGDGLRRIPYPEKLGVQQIAEFSDQAETFMQKNGLSSDYVSCILQDREGNVWVGTGSGIDRFQQRAVVPVELPPGTAEMSLTPQGNGTIKVSSSNKNLMQIMGGRAIELPAGPVAFNGSRIRDGFILESSYVRDPAELLRHPPNRVVFGSYYHPSYVERTQILSFDETYYPGTGTLPDAVKNGETAIRAITADSSGRKWYSIAAVGVFRVEKNGWTSLENLGGPKESASSEFTDSAGKVWFGFRNSSVVVLDGETLRTVSAKDGIAIGEVLCIQGGDPGLWMGGETGVSFFDGTRFRSMFPATEQAFAGVHGMVVTKGQGMWLAANHGIVFVPEKELQSFKRNPEYRVESRAFDSLDGLSEDIQKTPVDRSAVQGTDGKLWFATTQGVVWIDPQRIPLNGLPPPVTIEYLMADTMKYDLFSLVTLPPRPNSLQIHYAALSLSVPERVRFRYQLAGVDRGWQDVDTRRDAYYTNLGPGSYTFRVIACNDDGIWNETGAISNFVIAPAFYQTWWFRLVDIVLAVGLLWFFYLYRLNRATAQVQERLGARMEERERIARELHDTLLQGFQGLMLRFQAVMKTLPAEAPARTMMEQVLDRADEVLLEGRQSVRDIREEGTTGTELSEALLHCGEELGDGHSSLFSLTVVGEAQPIGPIVFDESYRIAREALVNAFQHSHAIKVEVDITYNESGLRLRVRDDGKGIDDAILSKGRSGHWGLSGMRERAQKIGAQLHIWSRPGAGTEIELRIPAEVAYPRIGRQSLWERFRRAARRASGDLEP